MAWKCKLIELGEGETQPDPKTRKPGDMWFWPNTKTLDEYRDMGIFSDDYLNNHASKHPPLCVVLPSNQIWNVNLKSSSGGPGWIITGEAPNITATPSILTERYHGFLQNGELTDDLEGRTYA